MSKNFTDPWASYPILKHKDRVVIQNENYSDLYEVIIEEYYSLGEIHLEKAEVRNRIAKLVKVKGK